MTTAKIVYASMTGNNEEIAGILEEELQDLDVETNMSEIGFTDPSELLNYDLNFMVVYTYGEGDMPDEVADFYDDLKELKLTNKLYAVMGSGDIFYEDHFCETVDDFDKLLTEVGAIKAAPSLKINLEADNDDIEHIANVAKQVVNKYDELAK